MYIDIGRSHHPLSKMCHIPQSLYDLKLISGITNIRQRQIYTTISFKTMNLHASQFISYRYLVVLIPHPFFKICSTDFRSRKYSFVKGRYGDLAITIDDVLFNLDQWFWIIIHRKNPILNL